MNQYVSEKAIQEAIEFFRKKEYGKPEQIGLYFFFKAMGVNEWSYTEYPKWGSMDEYQRRQVLRILYDLAGVFDAQKETGLKRTALFSFSIRKKYKAGTFYNGATPFQRLGSRVSDTLDNALVSTLLQRGGDADEGIKLREDSVDNLLENYLKGNKISLELMAAWYHRFWEIDIPQGATEKDFSDVCVLHLIKQLKLTANDYDRLFYYQNKLIEQSNNMVSGDSLRQYLAIDKDVEPEISKEPSQDFMQMYATVGSDEVSELLEQRGNALTEEVIKSILEENDQKIVANLPVQAKSDSSVNLDQDEYARAAEIIKEHLLESSFQFETTDEEITDFLYQFREKFSPEALNKLTDHNIRQEMFYTSEQTNDSLCYWLEFNSFSRKEYGSIAGGSAYKFGLFQRKEDGVWISGTPLNTQELTEEESLKKAYSIRDKLVKGAEIIKGKTFDSVDDYIKLEEELKEGIGDFYTYVWVMKYFLLMYPEHFTGFYWEGWQRHVLYALGIKPDASFLVRNGQIALVMKHTGLSVPHFGAAIYDRFGYVLQFVRIGTSDLDGNNYFTEWLKKSIAAIGWGDLGALDEYDTGSSLNKTAVAEKMQELYYPDDKRMASRKAGEVSTFYSSNENTVLVAMDGEKLLALGDKVGAYKYDSNAVFPHQKSVKWHRCFDPDDNLPKKSEGHLTTCKQLSDDDNLMLLYHKYYYDIDDRSGEIPLAVQTSDTGEKKDSDKSDNENSFRAWMAGQVTVNGTAPSPSMISNNCSALKKVCQLMDIIEYPDIQSVFEITDIDTFVDIKDIIKGHHDYDEVNKACNNRFLSTALNWYEKYLNEIHEAEEEEAVEETPDPYSKEAFLEKVFLTPEEYDKLYKLLLYKKNVILQGSPGVGKTFLAKRFAYSIIGAKDDRYIELIQFHQNYSYEDFIMGYKPTEDSFELKTGVFYNFCKKAAKDKDHKYFFIIDEINRGNLSKIFGELMMLIEGDKRGKDNCLTLAYRNEKFYVPENVYLIGMMNTADRSLAMMDYALRRRFSFFDVEPAFGKPQFKEYLKGYISDPAVVSKVISRFTDLNKKIADEENSGLGKGFCIGHSYFCNPPVEGQTDQEWYDTIIEFEVSPLLDEYWWDDKNKAEDCRKELMKD